jgi:hypothetical protein
MSVNPCKLTAELVANLNRNVMASIKERAPPRPWPVSFYDGRALAMSPDRTDVREWREGCWHYVDTQLVLAWLRHGCKPNVR